MAQPARRAMSDPAGINEPAPRVQRRTRTRGIAADRLMPMDWIDRFVIALAFPARSRRHAAKPPRSRWRCDEHRRGTASTPDRRWVSARRQSVRAMRGRVTRIAMSEARTLREQVRRPAKQTSRHGTVDSHTRTTGAIARCKPAENEKAQSSRCFSGGRAFRVGAIASDLRPLVFLRRAQDTSGVVSDRSRFRVVAVDQDESARRAHVHSTTFTSTTATSRDRSAHSDRRRARSGCAR